MKSTRWILCLVFLLVTTSQSIGQGRAPLTKNEYRERVAELPYDDRFAFAVATLRDATDPDATAAALREVLKKPRDPKDAQARNASALATVEVHLARQDEGSPQYQDAFYTRARLLHRFGRDDEATALFEHGMTQRWKAHGESDPFAAYDDSLRENDPALRSVEAFNRCVGDRSARRYAKVGDYARILSLGTLWCERRKGTLSASRDVLPHLAESPHRELAAALCLIADGQYNAAVERLVEIDATLPKSKPASRPAAKQAQRFRLFTDKDIERDLRNGYLRVEASYPYYRSLHDVFSNNEKRNIPYYFAYARMFEGRHLDEARAAMEDFYQLNIERPYYVAKKTAAH